MRVQIHNPRRRTVELHGVKLVDRLLDRLELNPDSPLVLVNGQIVTGDRRPTTATECSFCRMWNRAPANAANGRPPRPARRKRPSVTSGTG